jgi:ubiquinone biosynthesis protein
VRFQQTIKNLNRVREIFQVLAKYGFEDVITSTSLRNLVPRSRRLTWSREDRPVFEYSRWERIRMALEELGPTFIKFAQVLSNRPDVLPPELIEQFQKLQSDVAPEDFQIVRSTIENELGRPISEVFEFVIERPLGSASIGQVHRARLLSGEDVVIKVQRPRARRTVESDLAILREVVQRAEGYLRRQGLSNASDIVEALNDTMQRELDYRFEARSMTQFRDFYAKNRGFTIPRAYRDLCTQKVLVSEYVSGCQITDIAKLNEWGLKPEDIAQRGMDIYLTQIFEFGYFHADPHPGNVLVQEDGTLVLIDFGMIGRLQKRDKYAFAGIFIAMAQKNPRRMAVQFRRLATEHEIIEPRKLENDLAVLIDDFSGLDLGEGNMADLAIRLQNIIYEHRIKVPGAIFLILRALAILEGMGKSLSPKLNAYEKVKPFGQKLIAEQYSISNLTEEVSSRISDFDYLLRNFPQELGEILKLLSRGQLKVNLEDVHRSDEMAQRAKSQRHLSMAILAGSLCLGGSLIWTNPQLEMLQVAGIPIASFVMFCLAILIILRWLFD